METAGQELAYEIGGLGSTMLNVINILTALNKITSVATYQLDQDQIDYKANAVYNASVQSTLWGVRSDIANGWDTLSIMLLNGEVPVGSSDIITTIRDQSVGSTTFQNMVDSIKGTSINDTYSNNSSLISDIISWYDGGSNSEKEWTTQTNLTNAVIEFEFINNTAQFQLRAAILIFQSFSDAAGSLLSKINKVIGDMINQIG